MDVPDVAFALSVMSAGVTDESIAMILAPKGIPFVASRYIPTARPPGLGQVMVALPAVRVPETKYVGPETVLPTVRPAVLEHDTNVLPFVEAVELSAQLLTVTVLAFHESLRRVFHVVPS